MMQKKRFSKPRDKWVRTHDLWGVKATFKVICPHCNEEMFVRTSELTMPRRNFIGRVQVKPTVTVMYKCIPCAVVFWFYVDEPYVDNDYWNEILKTRGNHPLWVPPPESWSEDAKVQKRLKALGYLGGDYEFEEVTEVEDK